MSVSKSITKKSTGNAVVLHDNEAIEADQLTAQYQKAVSGLVEQVKCGAMLLKKKADLEARGFSGHGIKGDGLKGWIEERCPMISYRTAMRFKEFAEIVRDELQIGKSTDMALLLNSGMDALSSKQQRVRKHIESFLVNESGRGLIIKYRAGIESDKQRGGHPELNAFLKEHYPQLSGQRLSLADLEPEMRAEFEQWKIDQEKKRPSGIAWQRQRATEKWMEVERVILAALAKKDFGLMEFAHRKRVDELFAGARKEFAEAMK